MEIWTHPQGSGARLVKKASLGLLQRGIERRDIGNRGNIKQRCNVAVELRRIDEGLDVPPPKTQVLQSGTNNYPKVSQ